MIIIKVDKVLLKGYREFTDKISSVKELTI